jgi:hypothetical protein
MEEPKELFVPTMRLGIQASLPVESQIESTQMYEEIKRFFQSYHSDITLNGQVIMMLEPCCKKGVNKV